MSLRSAIVAVLFSLCLMPLWGGLVSGQEVPRVNFVVRVAEYYDVAYVDPPVAPARHLFFRSERIVLALDVGNQSDNVRTVDTSVPLAKAFNVEARVTPAASASVELRVNSRGALGLGAIRAPVDWGQQIELGPRATATWEGTLVGLTTPGNYEVHLLPAFGSSQQPVAPQGTIVRLELRAEQTLADRVEVARRRMMHELVFGDEVTVDAAAQDLLALYPQSALAYQIRGRVAAAADRNGDAQASFGRALQLLTSGADTLLLQHVSQRDLDGIVAEVRRGAGR